MDFRLCAISHCKGGHQGQRTVALENRVAERHYDMCPSYLASEGTDNKYSEDEHTVEGRKDMASDRALWGLKE